MTHWVFLSNPQLLVVRSSQEFLEMGPVVYDGWGFSFPGPVASFLTSGSERGPSVRLRVGLVPVSPQRFVVEEKVNLGYRLYLG